MGPRDARGPSGPVGLSLDAFRQDVTHTFRRLRRAPTLFLTAVVVLGLGLAASTAVFTYLDAYRRPFPGATPRGVHALHLRTGEDPFQALSYADYRDLEESTIDGVEGVAGVGNGFAASVRHEDFTEVVFGEPVTGSFFPVLEVEVAVGRGLGPADDLPGAEPAVVISHAYWLTRYEGQSEAVGRTIFLNGNPHTIVGVAGPAFLGSSADLRPEVWMPFAAYSPVYWRGSETATDREARVMTPYLRLRHGTTAGQAESTLAGIARSLDEGAPLESGPRRLGLDPATWIGPRTRRAEAPVNRLMVGATALLLLLACANVANLLMTLSLGRSREMALRAAQGASPLRLVRQLVTENVILGLLAGVVGLLLAGPAAARLGAYFARPSVWGSNVARVVEVSGRVFLFALALATATAVAAGLPAALRASRRNLRDLLSSLPGAGRSHPRRGVRLLPSGPDALVSLQVALALVLLVTSGLVLRTLGAVRGIEPGFATERLLATYLSTSSIGTPPEERPGWFRELADHLEAQPWVDDVATAAQAPLSPHPSQQVLLGGEASPVTVTMARVVPGFHETLEMPLVAGRSFVEEDGPGGPDVAIVNRTLAERHFGAAEPLGRQVREVDRSGAPGRAYEIVGVVEDARLVSLLDDPGPVIYLSYPQHYYTPGNAVLIRTRDDPALAVPRVEQELRRVSAGIALVNVLPYRDVVEGFTYVQRMNAELFSIVAGVGLLLTAVGLFAVLGLSVRRRTREIGVRLALGADRGAVIRLILAQAAAPVGVGLLAGGILALQAAPLLRSLVVGVEPWDPQAVGLALAALLLGSLAAVYVPIRRAVRIDPAASLRVD